MEIQKNVSYFYKRMKKIVIVSVFLALVSTAIQAGSHIGTVQPVKVKVDRLPNLNIARCGHSIFCINGEITVVGGHTSGFTPTATAEYLSDGEWHQIPTTYAHDYGISVVLKSGQVLLAGGCKDNLGSGQTYEAEMYDPVSHRFTGFGCMAQKRTLGSAIELDSGRVMITGNWYADDCIEMFDGKKFFTKVKDVTVGRVAPYLFRTSDGDVLIVNDKDVRCNKVDSIVIDRLHGKPFTVPLLKKWKPIAELSTGHSQCCFIGDESQGNYSYLMTVSDFDRLSADKEQEGKSPGQIAVMLVKDTVFSLLPTTTPIPMTTAIAGPIYYFTPIIVDRQSQKAYLYGKDKDKRLYVVCIDYAIRPAPLSLYYTDPLPDCGFGMPVLTADGNLAFVGGSEQTGFHTDNFQPVASSWLIYLKEEDSIMAASGGLSLYLLSGIIFILLFSVAFTYYHIRKRRHEDLPEIDIIDSSTKEPGPNNQLMARINKLMEERQLFRNCELKPSDIASELATNTRYITDSIKGCQNLTFSQYINNYRINYAKQLLRQHPDMQISEVYSKAGFASERSFFRIFKTVTGMTTREWMMTQQD